MAHPKFEGKTGKDGKFYFNLTAKNGQVILSSQGYASKSGVENGVNSIKNNSSNAAAFHLEKTAKGSPYFILKAANGEVVGRSEVYSSEDAAENGINSVKTNAPVAELEWQE